MVGVLKTASRIISSALAIPIVLANILTPTQAIIFFGICFGVQEIIL